MTIHIYETEDVTQQFLVARRCTIFTANSITKTAKLQLFILTDVTAFRDSKNKGIEGVDAKKIQLRHQTSLKIDELVQLLLNRSKNR